jgi:cytidylate kinase
MKNFTIAIDGPVGSGKGTLAMALAKKLNAVYIYTGAMYRELALACLREKIDINDEEKVLEVLRKIEIELKASENGVRAFLNGEDVSEEIFQVHVTKAASLVASFSEVRKDMVSMQKKLAENVEEGRSVIVEGRDISTDVMPDADLKVFLTADLETRAKRRLDQYKDRGVTLVFDEVVKDVEERDKKDTEREASPLKIAQDAVIIDTTRDTIDDTVNKVMEKLKERNLL